MREDDRGELKGLNPKDSKSYQIGVKSVSSDENERSWEKQESGMWRVIILCIILCNRRGGVALFSLFTSSRNQLLDM